MSVEENKAIVRRYLEPTNAATREERSKRLSEAADPLAELEKGMRFALPKMLAPDYVEHGPQVDLSLEDLYKMLPVLAFAFPDLAYKVHDVFGENDKVVVRYSAHGTHLGKYMDILPTEKEVDINGIYIGRVANGKIAEGWFVSTFFSYKEMPELLKLWLSTKS
jgi:predicted ester cyclase